MAHAKHVIKRSLLPACLIALPWATPAHGADTLVEALTSGKANLDIRLRYESVDNGSLPNAHASTLRSRLGYTTGEFNGASAMLEFEDTTALNNNNYSAKVSDPQGTEVNQAFLAYKGIPTTTVKYGRQRVILDNARWVGNVGWRQNEQTYDGLTLVNTAVPDTTLVYGYVTNVNGVKFDDTNVKAHLLNLGYKGFKPLAFTGYGYFLDFENAPTSANKTLGLRLSGGSALSASTKLVYVAEYAKQSHYKDGATIIDADYKLLEFGAEQDLFSAKLGYEVLGGNGNYALQTPLATKHAFNGWADMFLTTPINGLEDLYLALGAKLATIRLAAIYHDYAPNHGSGDYGNEINLLAETKVGNHTKAALKYAKYSAGNDIAKPDTTKLWLQGEFSF